jgi:hypothetical protein
MCDRKRPCGCWGDYHLADCPILTDRFSDPDEPPDPGEDYDSRWEEGRDDGED